VHSTAKTCVRWAVALFLSGAIVLVYGADPYAGLAGVAGANAAAGLDVVNILLTVVRSTAFPLGAVLVGAAIVIQTLAPRNESLDHEREDQGRATPRA
jgi:hypothetical protein